MCECNIDIDFNQSLCHDCLREANCQYPCSEFELQNMIHKLTKQKEHMDILLNKYCGESDKELNNDVDDFVESLIGHNVSEPEFLQCVNGKRMISSIIDWKFLLGWMTEKNEEYSKREGICEVCHAQLVERAEYEEIWGSRQISEILLVCPNNC